MRDSPLLYDYCSLGTFGISLSISLNPILVRKIFSRPH